MRDAESFAGETIKEFTGDCFTWCKADCMYQAIKFVPGFAQVGKYRFNLFVAGNVTVKDQFAIEFSRKISNPVFETFAEQ